MSALSDITTFARTGTATYVDSDGVLQTAADGVPRTAHHLWDGTAWVNAGLLLESEARTNLFPFSTDLDNITWTGASFGVTVTDDAGVAPDGSTTAARVQGLTSFRVYADSLTLSAGQAITISVWVKSNISLDQEFQLLIDDAIVSGDKTATQEWQRFSFSATTTSGTASLFGIADNVAGDTYDLLIWGPQLEVGATPSSYIPTTGTTATRNAETLTIASADAPWSDTAVSIQMEGTVTYADTNNAGEAEFFLWEADPSNRIRAQLRTDSFREGAPYFAQRQAGVLDFSLGPASSYRPGINVPFNIASRHGSTFINGAVNGTSLTVDTTPTALPDLSTTDIGIGPTFMGTIKLFRIWAEDIGDVGIASASST